MHRREFLQLSAGAGILAVFQAAGFGCADRSAPLVRLPELPYPINGLEPYISEKTLSFHHGKHHRGYVENTVRLAADSRFSGMGLVEVVKKSAGNPARVDLFNAAAQAWNHEFYWKSMTSGGGGPPAEPMLSKIRASFGSYERFADAFVKTGGGLFGSGWLWLIQNRQGIDLLITANAKTPIAKNIRPLVAVDLWEHAYYLDYQNRRGEYLQAVVSHLLNWDFAEENMGR